MCIYSTKTLTMKTKYLLFLISYFFLYSTLFSQNNSYITFFGEKYFVKEGTLDNLDKTYLQSQKRGIKYSFKGKNILVKENVRSINNPNFTMDSVNFEYYTDKDESFIIENVKYCLSKTITLNNVIDSVRINDIELANGFSLFFENKEIEIIEFKVLGDSIEHEINYKSKITSSGTTNKNAEKSLVKIIKDNSQCSKFCLKDISVYYKKKNQKYFLDFEIILYK